MRNLKYLYSLIFLMGMAGMTFAHVDPTNQGSASPASNTASLRADCAQGTSKVIQSINNVRAMLLNGGDVWWDLEDGQYVVPKVEPGLPEVSSIFAGGVWVGGFTPGGILKMAAQTYRNGTRTDFWPGPLTDVGTVGEDTCANWDRHFKVLGENIQLHLQRWEIAKSEGRTELDRSEIPADVLGWPAVGNEFFFDIYGFDLPENNSQGLAYFFDNITPGVDNQIGVYEPHKGDLPRIEIRDCDVETIKDVQYADEMYFWIYNDAGGAHTSSQGEAIRMEIQVQSFAWRTNDEINDMTFQRYKLINRAVEDIDSTFFSMWVDPDLGCYTDDYIGCDTTRSLAYVYNDDGLDGTTGCQCDQGVPTYCDEIPVLGVDYFRGPLNEFGEEIGMTSFTYANNGGLPGVEPGTADPNQPDEFYNYISGTWRDGTPYTFGGSGYNPGVPGDVVKYAFPDPPNDPSGWSMQNSNLPFGDRRTLQASGPFTLQPGAINELIVGVVWVPDVAHPAPDITKLLAADDIAQALFDNCFDITDGPDAPDVDFLELDKEIVMILTNGDSLRTNNSNEEYAELDLQAPPGLTEAERLYRFEGYRIYQLVGPNVSIAELSDPDKARLLQSVDVKNGISQLYNWSSIPDPGSTELIWIPELQNEGVLDNGISHTFSITQDLFAAGDNKLVNHKKYYYTVLAYAHNNWQQYDPVTAEGQRRPYLEGRRNIGDGDRPYYTVTPHPSVYKNLNCEYGDGPIITRLDGVGVGGNNVSISEETEAAIMDGSFNDEIVYKPGRGPINVKVYNPIDVKNGEFELTFVNANTGTNDGNDELDSEQNWQLTNLSDPSAPILSDLTIERLNEQIIREFGFSITVGQTDDVGDSVDDTNGVIGYDEINAGTPWFTSMPDGAAPFNYLKTGEGEIDFLLDSEQALSTMGKFVPYVLSDYQAPAADLSDFNFTPAWRNVSFSGVVRAKNPIEDLPNVDVIFTSDKSKWSRCVVLETALPEYTDPALLGLTTEGNAGNLDLRGGESVGKDGTPDGTGTGMGWFPGYAIDQETGKRLNIFFGENSIYYPEQLLAENYDANGRDMIWNPTDEVAFQAQNALFYPLILGGQHYIYVTKQEYDECAEIKDRLSGGSDNDKRKAFEQVSWTSMAMLEQGMELLPVSEGLIPSELRVELRVDNPYQVERGTNQFQGYPSYRFKIEGKEAAQVEPGGTNVAAALDMINVVPNPYYGYSAYETTQFTNIVKITNLPPKCDVTIYSLDGKFIRQYNRDEIGIPITAPHRGIEEMQISPALEWDLKNSKGIPVASGVYLIHVSAEGLGERVIKWFGVARKFDPSGL